MRQRDIMLIMSDQHGYDVTGLADRRVETPQLDRIAQEGAWFEHCYSNAPLCVPSRMSFLTGMLPSDLEIFDNDSTIPSDMPTIAHEFGRMGYHTVLIGRMHFKGDDQNHGFDERLCGEITSQYWGTGGKKRTDFGVYAGTTNRLHCLEQVGGGESPVTFYDRMVFHTAMDFLEQWHKQGEDRLPLLLIVGFYGPHFPFVCEKDLYRKYRERVVPEECVSDMELPALSVYRELRQECDAQLVRDCRAAYFGMAEMLDGYIGELYDRFRLIEDRRKSAFFYTSDHGEQLGTRRIFGKQTMYEAAVHVPLVAVGTGIPIGAVSETVSLLDLSRTLLAFADRASDFSWHQGVTMDYLLGAQNQKKGEHSVRIQQMLTDNGQPVLVEASVRWPWKVVRVNGTCFRYHLEQDPQEQNTEEVRIDEVDGTGFITENQARLLIERHQKRLAGHQRLADWGRQKHPREWACVSIPPNSLMKPVKE